MIRREARLDASESVWFERQLEQIDSRVFRQKFAPLKARQFVPVIGGIPEWARVYTWREVEAFGDAKIIAPGAEDFPTVDAKGKETTKIIKDLGNSYSYNVQELKAMRAQGLNITDEKAMAARRAVETKIDNLLAKGDSAHNLEGVLNLTGAKTFTLGTKKGGGKTWGKVGSPNATALEIVADLMGIASARVDATDGNYDRFRILLPVAQYNLAAQMPMGDDAGLTPLKFALANSPFIESIQPWHKCKGAGAASADRMVCYVPSEEVLGGIVPQEFMPMAPQLDGITYKIYNLASCGGVVLRYADAIAYADGL